MSRAGRRRTVPWERSFTSYTASLTCVCWLMLDSWKKAMLLRKMGLLEPCGRSKTSGSRHLHSHFEKFQPSETQTRTGSDR